MDSSNLVIDLIQRLVGAQVLPLQYNAQVLRYDERVQFDHGCRLVSSIDGFDHVVFSLLDQDNHAGANPRLLSNSGTPPITCACSFTTETLTLCVNSSETSGLSKNSSPREI